MKITVLAALCSLLLAGPARADDLSQIQWVTNLDDPPIGDPAAQKGGTFSVYATAYPLTFRLVGPDATDAFANWSHAFTFDFKLVRRHPTTDRFIPWMATAWSVQKDQRTIYFKLDPDARWSDGEKITADDYVFTYEMMTSKDIVDPFWNAFFDENFESVEALGPYLLKVVGKHWSWRPLDDFDLWPTPRHATHLGPNWVREANLKYPVVPGPYVVTEAVEGERVVFSRLKDWWGTDKRYFRGLYNVDRIVIKVVLDEDRAFDFFKKGELSWYRVNTAKKWVQDTDFEAVQKGWVHKKRLFIDYPEGLYGFCMNLEKPIFQDKNFRKAIQYAFNFDEINDKLMFGSYYRSVSAFEGSEFKNPDLKPYGFDPRKVREHLALAGYTQRDRSGYFVRKDGTRASFTLTYGTPGLTRHMTVVKQIFKKLGIEMKLQLLESGTAFQRRQERAYEMSIISQTTDFYPDPYQYFDSEFVKTKNNNNVFAFGNAKADSLIDVYRFDPDADRRLQAMHDLDALIQDEAFYVPFWKAPFLRFVYWDSVRFPSFFFPKRTEQVMNWQVFWIDGQREAALAAAMKSGKALGRDGVVDVDPYGLKADMTKDLGSVER
jgi:microcin C transport system substrate-binding protein